MIWDLDETFWEGTLTEGGIRYIDAHHRLVVELAERGIVSSICSKNDFAPVETLLQQRGLWDYFIFPSIDWTSKAARIKAQIEAIGLRPATVLFIDDNWQNLQQAAFMIQGLNVCEPSHIPFIEDHPRFVGKPDADLKRLKQYKNNERKKLDLQRSGGDTIAFLRTSDVKIYFEYDVEQHLDRVIELINRTNQLNFTKARLPEDPEEAKAALLPLIRHSGTTAGLIRVVDRFGDYGFVGFFAMVDIALRKTLKHFCFSCRTIDMYVEHFVYNYLGRPTLTVVGEVLSDVGLTDQSYDWIKVLPYASLELGHDQDVVRISGIFARGGCDLMSLMHYFTLNCSDIKMEFNTIKYWQPIRLDHSAFLLNALDGLTPEQYEAAAGLGYDRDDFITAFPTTEQGPPVCLLSFWADVDIPYYRHTASGLELPYFIIGAGLEDLTFDDDAIARLKPNEWQAQRLAVLRRDWEYCGRLDFQALFDRYHRIISRIPESTKVFMTLANDRHPAHFSDPVRFPKVEAHVLYNEVLTAIAECFENVNLVDFRKYVNASADVLDINHLRRDLYFLIYNDIISRL